MMNERCFAETLVADKFLVTIRNGEWRFRGRCGYVAAQISIHKFPVFSEIAVLACRDSDRHQFAARIVETDDWAHFHELQPWMQSVVENYLTTQDRYSQIADLVAKTHRLTLSQ